MSDKLMESNHQNQHDNIDGSEQKRHKPNESKSEDNEVVEPKAITNIYYDCLERIFEFLDLESLLMVADTCKRLQIAAAAYFGDVYGKKHIFFRRQSFFNFQNGFNKTSDDDKLFIIGPKSQLPLLRCFGNKILHLHLHFNEECEISYMTVLNQYVNQYCAGTLTTIDLNANQHPSLKIEKSFANVEKLELSGSIGAGTIDSLFPNVINPFPKLRVLDMHWVDTIEQGMTIYIPSLQHLDVSIDQYSIGHIATLLDSNLQLQSCSFWIDDADAVRLFTVLDAIWAHQSITILKVATYRNVQVSVVELHKLMNERRSITELYLKNHKFTADNVIRLLDQLNSLKKFEFRIQDKFEYNRLQEALDGKWHFKISAVIIELTKK